MGGSMGSQPQKTQGFEKFFFHCRFCRDFNADHFDKKIFLIARLFLML
jgi:hypothetical protein